MATNSNIEWCHHTFSPWHGCSKISPGCKHCYAETLTKRFGGDYWGNSPRKMMSDAYWKEPLKWARDARNSGTRQRVFCASMADVFEDRPELVEPRKRLEGLIFDTADALDWLLLTKRPDNVPGMMPVDVTRLCWLGTSVEDQEQADKRIPHLLKCAAAVRFLSCEPLLGPVDLETIPDTTERVVAQYKPLCGLRWEWTGRGIELIPKMRGPRLDWIVVGGESGPGARPFHVEWARSIQEQCKAAGVAFFNKQLGSNPYMDGKPLRLTDRKGGDMSEWPADLRVRETPR